MDNSQNSDNGYNKGGQSDNNNSGNYNQGANNDYNNNGQFDNGYVNQNPNGNGYNNGQFNNGYNHNNGYNPNNFNNGYNNGNQFNNGYNNFNRQPYYQKPKDKLGIFSLIFGIASVLTSMLYFVGIPLAITAIVLAIHEVGLVDFKELLLQGFVLVYVESVLDFFSLLLCLLCFLIQIL